MTVANQDFDVDEGSSRNVTVPLTNNGAPYVVPAGGVVRWWASYSQFDATPVIQKSTAFASVGLSTAGGQTTVSVFLQAGDTAGLGQKKLFHQAWLNTPDGTTLPLFSGTMTVVKRLVV